MSYFDDLIDASLIQRELSVRGKTVPTWWKPLTAGQRVELLRGQVVRSDGESASAVEVDLAQSAERSQRMVVMTLCTQDGQAVYRALKDLQSDPSWLIDALVDLARKVHDEGNG